jgi:hypothetical protein
LETAGCIAASGAIATMFQNLIEDLQQGCQPVIGRMYLRER